MVVSKRVCKVCGASYSTGSLAIAAHRRVTGHDDFKTVRETRPDEPTRISYQPGYGPEGK